MLFFRRAPSVLAGPGRTSNPLTALLRTPRREGRLRAMQVIDELVTAGVWESPSQALPLPLSCGAFDTLLFGTNMTEFVKIIGWDRETAANDGVTFDATRDCVNDLFEQNGGVWLMEVSPDGSTFYEWSVYKQIQERSGGFDAHGYIYWWRNAENLINQQFELYSDVNDAISESSMWATCTHNDAQAGFAREHCCRSASQAFEPGMGGAGWGFSMPTEPLPTPAPPPAPPAASGLPASCGALDALSFGTDMVEFAKIIDWDRETAANDGVTFDATQDCVNDLFEQNGGVWLLDGSTFYEWSVYKQIQERSGGFDAHGYIYWWRNADNLINQQFELYSDVKDAISGSSMRATCTYNDAQAGFARDCCCRSASQAFEPGMGGAGWGFFAPSSYRTNIRWPRIRFSMPTQPLPTPTP